jgi:hypothetical protein
VAYTAWSMVNPRLQRCCCTASPILLSSSLAYASYPMALAASAVRSAQVGSWTKVSDVPRSGTDWSTTFPPTKGS